MGSEKSTTWYDGVYTNKHSVYRRPVEESGYYNLYKTARDFLPENRNTRILELGCGSGQLASLLLATGYINYLGVDFSKVAIGLAKRHAPKTEFRCMDFATAEAQGLLKQFDSYMAIEVLEHINKDLELLTAIPIGKQIILSVPSSAYTSHVRVFKDLASVNLRYNKVMSIDKTAVLGAVFVVSGMRREKVEGQDV